MTTPISAAVGSGGAAVAPAVQVQPKAAAPAAATAAEDTVKISAAAQEVQQPMSVRVRLLRVQGMAIAQIATELAISPSAVQSYLGKPAQAARK